VVPKEGWCVYIPAYIGGGCGGGGGGGGGVVAVVVVVVKEGWCVHRFHCASLAACLSFTTLFFACRFCTLLFYFSLAFFLLCLVKSHDVVFSTFSNNSQVPEHSLEYFIEQWVSDALFKAVGPVNTCGAYLHCVLPALLKQGGQQNGQ